MKTKVLLQGRGCMETILTSPITDKCAWKGKDIADKDDWIIRLDQHLISVLDNALKTI